MAGHPAPRRSAGRTALSQQEHKRLAAQAALDVVLPSLRRGAVVGVGTGSTASLFIDVLAQANATFEGAVSSSNATTERLRAAGIPVLDPNAVGPVVVYVDGADEVAADRALVKGGGGALTREKILAASAERFVCIVDATKVVARLGAFPLAVEILPFAQRFVRQTLRELGGDAAVRQDFVTDNGNHILDVRGLDIAAPEALERRLNAIPGVLENGVFAAHRPHQVLIAGPRGVELRE